MKTKTRVKKVKRGIDKGAEDALAYFIKHRAKNPGFVKEMAERMSKRTGTVVLRQQIEAWLHPNAKKRVEPKLRVGLILIEEGERATREVRK